MAVSDASYKEGYGKNANGHLGGTDVITYTVDDPQPGYGSGFFGNTHGTMEAAILARTDHSGIHDMLIQFDLAAADYVYSANQGLFIGSNTTIDGLGNGMNGVIFDNGGVGDQIMVPSQPVGKKGYLIHGGTSNVVIQGLNFVGYGWPMIEYLDPTHAQGEANFIWLAAGSDSSTGDTISTVLVDRCTFTRATNKAFDITAGGSHLPAITEYVTLQRCIIQGGALGSHIKYADGVNAIHRNISLHHNLWIGGAERHPQMMDNVGPIDYINNVILVNPGDVTSYPFGDSTDPYGVRAWCPSAAGSALRIGTDTEDPYYGEVHVNIEGCYFGGSRGNIQLLIDTDIPDDPSPATGQYVYIAADNVFEAATPIIQYNLSGINTHYSTLTYPTIPHNSQNTIPSEYQVTKLPVSQLRLGLLPSIGCPRQTTLDATRLVQAADNLRKSENRRVGAFGGF